MSRTIVVLNDRDNVATCLATINRGDPVTLEGGGEVMARDDIEFGHKLALGDISQGEDIIKYGEVIGRASQPIAAGEWVHIHNVEAVRARGDIA